MLGLASLMPWSWRDTNHVILATRADHHSSARATVGCQHRILRQGEVFACIRNRALCVRAL